MIGFGHEQMHFVTKLPNALQKSDPRIIEVHILRQFSLCGELNGLNVLNFSGVALFKIFTYILTYKVIEGLYVVHPLEFLWSYDIKKAP
jgi:hypothetical protein